MIRNETGEEASQESSKKIEYQEVGEETVGKTAFPARRGRASSPRASDVHGPAANHREAFARRANFLRRQARVCDVRRQSSQRSASCGVDPGAPRLASNSDQD